MRKLLAVSFTLGLRLNAALTRLSVARIIEGRLLTPLFIWFTRLIRGRPPASVTNDPVALGGEWERLIGNRRYAHVTSIEAATSTAYGEISGHCPLRGSGDVAACHRLMAYDRGLLAAHNARFVVLRSQAEPGRDTCQIAIRPQTLDARDLVPAHLRKRESERYPS